jgi:hypothetical protein
MSGGVKVHVQFISEIEKVRDPHLIPPDPHLIPPPFRGRKTARRVFPEQLRGRRSLFSLTLKGGFAQKRRCRTPQFVSRARRSTIARTDAR